MERKLLLKNFRSLYNSSTILILFFTSQMVIAQSTSTGALRINPDNPHYFTYKDKAVFWVTDTNESRLESPGHYEDFGQFKFNHKGIILMTATNRSNNPYNNEDINSGWNDEIWNDLRENVRAAMQNDIIIGIRIWSTPMLERGERRWATHLWNERTGGPIPDDGDGKDEFYTLDSYGNEISEAYSDNWSWQKKNQFRQEELIKKYLSEMAEFPNVYFVPMYELGDHWGSTLGKAHRWRQHIVWFIKKYQPNRLTATVISTTDEKEVASWSDVDFILFEGPAIAYGGASKDLRDSYWSFNKPLVWLFLFPNSLEQPESEMRLAVVNGVQPASVFRNVSFGEKEYTLEIQRFAATINTWSDEPGNEINNNRVPPVSGYKNDSDGDGIPDWYEDNIAGLDRNTSNDASGDLDNDGITNLQEYRSATNPLDGGSGEDDFIPPSPPQRVRVSQGDGN